MIDFFGANANNQLNRLNAPTETVKKKIMMGLILSY